MEKLKELSFDEMVEVDGGGVVIGQDYKKIYERCRDKLKEGWDWLTS